MILEMLNFDSFGIYFRRRSLGGDKFAVEIPSGATVQDLKQTIARTSGTPVGRQRLFAMREGKSTSPDQLIPSLLDPSSFCRSGSG